MQPMTAGSQEMTKNRRGWVMAAMVLGVFMTAIEVTVIATATPSIVSDLGGFHLYSWLFAIYLLPQAATVPLFGKLADLYGRKRVYSVGVLLFLLGTILCGMAPSMPWLIAYRGVQGLGAAAVMPIAMTIIGDIYSPTERARVQGYLSSVFGISAILGPVVGGFIVSYWTWPWVFYINVPLGVLSLILLWRFHREPAPAEAPRLDVPGAVLLVAGTSALVILLSAGEVAAWLRALLLGTTIAALAGFVWWEQRANEPLLPLDLLQRRALAAANVATLLAGMVIIGPTTVVPTLVQGVLGESPTVAGFSLTAMSIGWPLASSVSGFIMLRFGYRRTAQAGSLLILMGSLVLSSVGAGSSPLHVAAGAAVIGAGLGLATTTYLISIQTSVDYTMRGIATASNAFARQLGQALGASILGGLLIGRLSRFLAADRAPGGEAIDIGVINRLLDPAGLFDLSPELLDVIRTGLEAAARGTFWAMAATGALIFIVSSLLPAYGPQSQEKGGRSAGSGGPS